MTKIEQLQTELREAEAVVVGAGAGLSASAGYEYGGSRFLQYFGDFAERYGIHDMYEGGFYPFPTREEFWGYWSRYIFLNRFCPPPKRTYEKLLGLITEKDYFVITTNVDHCFQRAGFQKNRLFYTQGDFGSFQCSLPCSQKTYDNEGTIRKMVVSQQDGKIPSALIPHCPICGREMSLNLRTDDTFAEDDGWHAACKRYTDFLERHERSRTLFLELGVGSNTPSIIKYPFWRLTAENPSATYACIDLRADCPAWIQSRAILIREDIDTVLTALLAQ